MPPNQPALQRVTRTASTLCSRYGKGVMYNHDRHKQYGFVGKPLPIRNTRKGMQNEKLIPWYPLLLPFLVGLRKQRTFWCQDQAFRPAVSPATGHLHLRTQMRWDNGPSDYTHPNDLSLKASQSISSYSTSIRTKLTTFEKVFISKTVLLYC